jgi:hypothetical protein
METAVEWLGHEINKIYTEFPEQLFYDVALLLQKAKQMEKNNLYECGSFWRGKENKIEKPFFEQYYTETFKSE